MEELQVRALKKKKIYSRVKIGEGLGASLE